VKNGPETKDGEGEKTDNLGEKEKETENGKTEKEEAQTNATDVMKM
jgi:hypothetical protein